MADQDVMNELVASLADDLREIVTEIEGGMQTTQNHYGRYMSVLAAVGQNEPSVKKVVAAALIKAGANHAGVSNALNLST